MSIVCNNEDRKVCQNGGTCVVFPDPESNFCSCPEGYTGGLCHGHHAGTQNKYSYCTSDGGECNGGTCVEESATIGGVDVPTNYCKCPKGTFGNNCHLKQGGSGSQEEETDFQEAAEAAAEAAFAEDADPVCTENGNQCKNGGFCAMKTPDNQIKANRCICPEKYGGDRCEKEKVNNSTGGSSSETYSGGAPKDKDWCTKGGNECQNGAPCVLKTIDGSVPYSYCDCPKGYFGALCHGKHHTPTTGNSGNSGNTSTNTNTNKFITDSKNKSVCTENGNQCQNGGVCVKATDQIDGTEANYCSCPEGTSGTLCHGKDVCPLKCQNGSSCRHYDDVTHGGELSFFCDCVGNYKGLQCEIPFSTCPKTSADDEGLECLFGGECAVSLKSNEYSCSCPKGRSGKSCESGTVGNIKDWNGNCNADADCKNGGLCVRSHDAKESANSGMDTTLNQCLCTLGWGGDNCDIRCDSLNCQHGASCRFRGDDISHGNDSSESGAYCDCKDGFKGKECEIATLKCSGANDIECLYGGVCIGSEDDLDGNFYKCLCPAGRTGEFCEKIDTSNGMSEAPNGGYKYTPPPPGGSKASASTVTSSNLQPTPNPIIVTISVLAFLLVVPVALFCLYKNRVSKNQDDVEESIDGTSAATSEDVVDKVVNGDGTADAVNEDIFDYDTDGVVNVNLDENEPVELPKDKQIV